VDVSYPELAAGDRVHDGAVAGAVVGQYPFDLDAVAAIESKRAPQEADC